MRNGSNFANNYRGVLIIELQGPTDIESWEGDA